MLSEGDDDEDNDNNSDEADDGEDDDDHDDDEAIRPAMDTVLTMTPPRPPLSRLMCSSAS